MRIALVAIALGACMPPPPAFPSPFTAAAAVEDGSGPALVAYLGQRDASAAICEPAGTPPHFTQLTPELRDALVGGLADGSISPTIWRACAKSFATGVAPADAIALYDAALGAYEALVTKRDLDTNPAEVERATAIQRFYLNRKLGLGAHPNVVQAVMGRLRDGLRSGKLGRVAAILDQELVETDDIEHDRWQGRPIDAALLDELAKTGNETTLRRILDRAPSGDLRTEARRRVIRIHIALSPFAEVRAAGPELEEQILTTGHNAVKLDAHPVVRAWFDAKAAVQRQVVVRQNIFKHTAQLFGMSADHTEVSVLPDLPLHGALRFELTGISQPVTVCARGKALDPSPCVAAGDLGAQSPFTTLAPHGIIKFHDDLKMSDVLPLAAQATFDIPITAGGKPAVTLAWGLSFARPADLVFRGDQFGANAPDVEVHVGEPRAGRVMFDANARGQDVQAIVEASDLGTYQVGSVGADGEDGEDGADGASGADGGDCGDGGDGGNGDDGGDGGNGGNGGNVTVSFACTTDCGDLSQRLQAMHVIVSKGGAGGRAGSGGRGGSGGAGGTGRSETSHTDENGNTVVDDPGCSGGTSGTDGTDGADGSPGSPGHGGIVMY